MLQRTLNGNNAFEDKVKKEELKRELKRNIVTGAILRAIHKRQGTETYLLQVIEPY